METILIILKQIIIMFILALIGYIMFKRKKISIEGSKTIGNILIYLSLPCVIINSFLVEKTTERLTSLLISALLAAIILVLSALISRLVLGKNAIDNFAGSFSNPGFFGIPIITACIASDAVFYVAAFIAFLNMGQWTYGVWLLNNSDDNGILIDKQYRTKQINNENKVISFILKLLKAPFMVAIIIGLFFFLTGISMPEIPAKCINFIANLNTPLAMFTVGIYMAQVDIKKMFSKLSLYKVALVRMIIAPIASILVMCLVPSEFVALKMAVLIAAACPVGSNVAVYAGLHDKDYAYAVETVVISTILSIITMPLMVTLANALWVN